MQRRHLFALEVGSNSRLASSISASVSVPEWRLRMLENARSSWQALNSLTSRLKVRRVLSGGVPSSGGGSARLSVIAAPFVHFDQFLHRFVYADTDILVRDLVAVFMQHTIFEFIKNPFIQLALELIECLPRIRG